jgi:hypothetical protein
MSEECLQIVGQVASSGDTDAEAGTAPFQKKKV